MASTKKIEQLQKDVQSLKTECKEICSKSLTYEGGPPPKIILIGETGSGKSSLISSFQSAVNSRTTVSSMHGGKHSEDKITFSKRYKEFPVRMEEEPVQFVLCDTMGFGNNHSQTAVERQMDLLLEGKFRDGDRMDVADGSAEEKTLQGRTPEPPSYVIIVQNMTATRKENDVCNHVAMWARNKCTDTKGCVILTHVDQMGQKDWNKAIGSERGKFADRHTKKAATEFGVPENRVFMVTNYTKEQENRPKLDLHILRALYAILSDLSADRSSPDRNESERPRHPIVDCTLPVPDQGNRERRSSDVSLTTTSTDSGFGELESTPSIPRSTSDEINMLLGPSSDQTQIEFLQSSINKLTSGKHEERLDLVGAKATYVPCIVFDPGRTSDIDARLNLRLQLVKHMFSEGEFFKSAANSLLKWCEELNCCIWMSDTLPVDLSLPMEDPEPSSVDVQAFVLSVGKPPVLLTVFDPKRACTNSTPETKANMIEEEELVREYTVRMGRLLSTALLNYCCCNFVILPCIITAGEFDIEKLTEEVQRQTKNCRVYLDKNIALDSITYAGLKQAASIVATVTSAPHHLQHATLPQDEDDSTARTEADAVLTLMDPKWHDIVSLLIECLVFNQSETYHNIQYTPEKEDKMRVAVVEAAKRLSFSADVVIVTHDVRIKQCCEGLKRQVEKDTGVVLKLKTAVDQDTLTSAGTSTHKMVIVFDSPGCKPPPKFSVLFITKAKPKAEVPKT